MMPTPQDYERAVKRGVCEVLAAETFLVWHDPDEAPLEPYSPTEVGLYDGIVAADVPAGVAVTTYPVQFFPDTIVGVQFRTVAEDPDLVTACVQAVADVMEGRWGGTLGAITLVSAAWSSGTNLGQDGSGRRGRTDNYYLTINRHSTQR